MMHEPSLFTGLSEALSILVLKREGVSRSFHTLHSIPEWYRTFLGKSLEDFPNLLPDLDSPFLKHFLPQVHEFLDGQTTGQLTSGIWCEQGADGKDYQFEATAVASADTQLLLIQRMDRGELELQTVLQTAREGGLQHQRDMAEHKQVERQLGGKLERSEQLRDDLLVILDRLQLGTIMTDAQGRMTFVSRVAQELLKLKESDVIGRLWHVIPAFSADDKAALEDMIRQPIGKRTKVPVVFESVRKRRVSLEIDVQQDPRDPQRTIFFLYDVTEVHDLREVLTGQHRFFDLVGKSPAITDVYARIQDIAPTDATVLIEGETGTGKELVARAIHQASPRKGQPFIAVNCAGLTDSLLGSQLFGHKRGAFTGAMQDHQGFFEAAHMGTLFLDEIGDMPLSIQTTLLRVLQEKEIMRVGESHPRSVDVRVVTATHQNLQELVKTGKFRSDLLYRVRVARLNLPALRDRREDIPLLCDVFFRQSRTVTKKMDIQEISSDTMRQLMKYHWPGNVRELKSALDYACIHCHGGAILPSDLPPECWESVDRPLGGINSEVDEREQIVAALTRAKGKRAEAARLLGMSRSTLYRRLDSLGLPTKD
ncbi:MAG: sigma-54-dependent Fis family transcriptional regulator [Nitrospirales bacterium]|nr:MAG: sigma-54-dependent Fis family transcriptional regulator [Nitrospirales bacterium]